MGEMLGRYRLEHEVGRGGMSVVYRAWDPTLQRPVAVKVLHPHLADRRDARTRFSREAQTVARLQHRNIVEVHDFSPPDSERAYIVTEFIDGPTLRSFVEQHQIKHAEVVALVMLPVIEALGHAHQAGIVHRDVKPENIMIRPDGSPVLMDFGIAQMIDMDTLTATGTMLGSPAHMAPEIIEGEEITEAADMFSLGTVLYWLVTGALPFSAPNPAALFRRVLECRFDPVLARRPQAGRAIARTVEWCMARRPEDRPADTLAVIHALRSLLTDAGMENWRPELKAYLRDPEVYQDNLTGRLVTAHVQAAQRAYDARLTARSLDFLDRALTLHEGHPDATALLQRIERGQWWLRSSQIAAAALVLAGGVALAWQLTPTPRPPTTPPLVVAKTIVVLDGGVRHDPSVEPDTTLSALMSLHPDAGPVDAAASVDATVDATLPDAQVVAKARRRRSGTFRRLRHARRAKRDAGIDPARPTTVARLRVKSGMKGAMVYVDGAESGRYLYQIDTGQGLKLGAGTHRIRIEDASCQPMIVTREIKAGQTVSPDIHYRCDPRPAYFVLRSNITADVRRQSDNALLGRTNENIQVRMTTLKKTLRLTVGDPADKFIRLDVEVGAGKLSPIEVKF